MMWSSTMSKHLIFVTLAIALAACSAAAQNDASLESSAGSNLLGASSPAPTSTGIAVATEAAPVESVRAQEAAVSCDVRAQRTANGLLIRARASADRDVDGEYDLVITKSGANAAEISQSGVLSIAAGSSVTLGENEISVERGARVRALLTLRDAHGTLCRRSVRL
jgi:hypothetical protein